MAISYLAHHGPPPLPPPDPCKLCTKSSSEMCKKFLRGDPYYFLHISEERRRGGDPHTSKMCKIGLFCRKQDHRSLPWPGDLWFWSWLVLISFGLCWSWLVLVGLGWSWLVLVLNYLELFENILRYLEIFEVVTSYLELFRAI